MSTDKLLEYSHGPFCSTSCPCGKGNYPAKGGGVMNTFTREDVEALMYAVNDLRSAAPDVDDWDAMLAAASTLHSLANRIHTLLPPEPK
jgi:hypothetical protein